MYKKFVALIICCIAAWGYSSAQQATIPFSTYMQYVEELHKFEHHINKRELHSIYTDIQHKPCQRLSDSKYFYVDPICLYQNKLPSMEFTQVVDTIRPYVEGFSVVYNATPTETFHYEGSVPIYTDNRAFDFLLLQKSQAHKAMATYHSIEEDKIQIPKHIIAQILATDYTFYASYNDTSMRRGCTKTNYDLALASMDKVLLYPGHSLNFNRHIAGLPYCTGRGRTDLMFYSGVCGSASQLYRVALLLPHMHITQRHGHSERRGYYYGNDITGDDATIYEMHKQLEIKNKDNRGVYFRAIQEDNYDYLVAVSPYRATHGVKITRERETALRTNLTKSVYHLSTRNYYTQENHFPTRYIRKNNTRN